MIPIITEEFNSHPTPFARPFQEFDYAYSAKPSKEVKLSSVDMASISTNVSRTGYFSRNNSHSKLSSILEDDDQEKMPEEEKRPKYAFSGVQPSRKVALSIPETSNSVVVKKPTDIEKVENLIFKQKTSAPKQKISVVKRNHKRNET